jgi:hypothetical protein
MSSVATRASTGSAELRLLAARKSRSYCSPLEQELFLAQGGTLADWYACAAAPAPLTPEDERKALLARLIRMMPDGLSPDEQAGYIAAAERRTRR